jgi:hypothetical protein
MGMYPNGCVIWCVFLPVIKKIKSYEVACEGMKAIYLHHHVVSSCEWLRCIEQVRCTGCIAWWFGLDVLQGSGSRLVYEALLDEWGGRSLGVVT